MEVTMALSWMDNHAVQVELPSESAVSGVRAEFVLNVTTIVCGTWSLVAI